MEVSEIIVRRFLAGFEQRAGTTFPGGWEAPRPEPGKRRQSAAVLLRVAELPTLAEMERFLEEIAARVAGRPGHQAGAEGEEEARGRPAESRLWSEMAALVRGLPVTQPGAPPSLFSLAICRDEPWIRSLETALRAAGAERPAASGESLAELARILLRAKARQWSDEDRRAERGEERAS